MINTKTLFAAAVLAAVSSVSFAQTPAAAKDAAVATTTATAPVAKTEGVDATSAPVAKKHHAHKHDAKKAAATAPDVVVAK